MALEGRALLANSALDTGFGSGGTDIFQDRTTDPSSQTIFDPDFAVDGGGSIGLAEEVQANLANFQSTNTPIIDRLRADGTPHRPPGAGLDR